MDLFKGYDKENGLRTKLGQLNYEMYIYCLLYSSAKWSGWEHILSIKRTTTRQSVESVFFLICGEGLSSLMRLVQREDNFRGVKASRRGPQISHLLFADDCILFGEATERGAGLLKRVLREYRKCSGQQVNFDKSTVFFSSNTRAEEKGLVARILGVRSTNDPERYLGLPNMVGRRKKKAFQNLKDRFRQRIDNWSIRHLSQGGKEVFIKAILQAIPKYTMAYFLLSKMLCSDLESIIAKFWW
ncbi:LINE-1 reverse transcriptase isogeny [Gossypium australe]|uniref:LINE-1 reverse transcriptase isogeny n=1 Tax=Gossypium australe TaxID=47621 RepID=A0A5B6WMM9_9ROSI|nr:LINE-1 reverse transcriptase isogeny [Gossypium australe]